MELSITNLSSNVFKQANEIISCKTERKNPIHQTSIDWKIPHKLVPLSHSRLLVPLPPHFSAFIQFKNQHIPAKTTFKGTKTQCSEMSGSRVLFQVVTWNGFTSEFCWCRKAQILNLSWWEMGDPLPIVTAKGQANCSFKMSTDSHQWSDQWVKVLPAVVHSTFTSSLWATAGSQFKAKGQSFQMDLQQVQGLDFCSCWSFKEKLGED